MQTTVPLLLITGPSGVGKTTVASEVSELLDQAGIAHALVDIDSLRWCYPRPAHDRFRVQLAMKNLAAVWVNFQEAGATSLVVADVVESRDELERYQAAVPGAVITVVRLQASTAALTERLGRREVGSALERHTRRAAELADLMTWNQVEDVLIDTEGKSVNTIAREALLRANWLQETGGSADC
ncbi:MAG TPA: AAA family ATPase [Ktedonobacterales bacterium]|nr:AAA family ATPase [Ktedonobacterales bacterium]